MDSFIVTFLLLFSLHYAGALSAEETTRFNDECLNAHNVLRALHPGTGAMTWNDDVAKGAQEWANHLATLGKMEHASRSSTGLGENLYTAWWGLSGCRSVTCSAAVRAWYMEINDYDYATNDRKATSPGKVIGHFTQVVWKGSTEVGAGIAYGKRIEKVTNADGVEEEKVYNAVYIVGRYKPDGNIIGRRPENVLPQQSGAVVPTSQQLFDGTYTKYCGVGPDGGNNGPVDGGWSAWTVNKCDANCRQSKSRTCNNPKPSYGGKWCRGINRRISSCTGGDCDRGTGGGNVGPCAKPDAWWCKSWTFEKICKGFGGEYAKYCPSICCSVLQ